MMKNLISVLVLSTIFLTTAFGNANPTVKTYDFEHVTISALEVIKTANFNSESETIDFTTITEISVLQIFDQDGNMEFLLPVMSNNVKINMNLLGEGNYKLGFIMEGDSNVHISNVTIK